MDFATLIERKEKFGKIRIISPLKASQERLSAPGTIYNLKKRVASDAFLPVPYVDFLA